MSVGAAVRGGARSGVSLIEVLVALFILAVSIAGISQVVETAIRQMERAEQESIVRRLARERLLVGEIAEGAIDAAYGIDGRWHVEHNQIASGLVGSVPVQLIETRVVIEWQNGPESRTFNLARQQLVPDIR